MEIVVFPLENEGFWDFELPGYGIRYMDVSWTEDGPIWDLKTLIVDSSMDQISIKNDTSITYNIKII